MSRTIALVRSGLRAMPASPPAVGSAWLLVCPVLAHWHLTLLLVGDADDSTAEQLRWQLADALAAWPYATVIDVSGLTFCGPACFEVLREAVASGAITNRDVRVVGPLRAARHPRDGVLGAGH